MDPRHAAAWDRAMKLPLQITFRDMAPLPSLEAEIRRRVAKFDQWTSGVMSCHVVVEAEGIRHRQGHAYQFKLDLRLPGEEIMAGTHQRSEDPHVALRDAFDAMDRQLEDHARRRRGQTKHHAQPAGENREPLGDDEASAP
jgi:ribosomal subunit interface protein